MMTERYEMLDSYTLHDYEDCRSYTTGVSLADCGIPFVELLNRLDNYRQFHKENQIKCQRENKKLWAKLEEYEKLLKDFEDLYESSVEEMVAAEQDTY